MSNLFTELKRRNVFRVGFAYVIMAWLLAQITDLVVDNVGAPEWVMKIILLVLAIGFPIALFFAWAFEMTADGFKREHEVNRSQSITPQTGRKLDRMIGGAIAIAVLFLLVDRFIGPEQGGTALPTESTDQIQSQEQDRTVSIAVLPFINMSSDPEQEYFSDGISEEILNQLVRVDGLSVASRTSAFAYKGQDLGLDGDGTDFIGLSSIGTYAVQRLSPQIFPDDLVNPSGNGRRFFGKLFGQLLLYLSGKDVDISVTRRLNLGAVEIIETGLHQWIDGLVKLHIDGWRGERALGLPHLGGQRLLQLDKILDDLLGVLEGRRQFLLRNLVGFTLHHDDGILFAHHDDVHSALIQLGPGGVQHQFIIHFADTSRCNRAVPGNV